MHLNVINPTGMAYSVDLAALPLWRLEIDRWSPRGAPATRKSVLGLVLRYVIGVATVEGAGQTVTQVVHLAGIDTGTDGDELLEVVAKGFPHADRAENRATMKDSLGMLHNAVQKAAEADDIITRALTLVDLRHDLLEALWQQKPDSLLALGPRWSATYEGYRCALVTNRFDPWLGGSVAPASLAADPVVAAARKGKGKAAAGPSDPPP